MVSYHGNALRTVLGGTGLAISAHSQHRDIALDYLPYTASAAIQKTLFF
ncbi:hypothetical protein [Sodalis praecaptivus]|nr:hypothetical protein [Sodalis praecaptivus]